MAVEKMPGTKKKINRVVIPNAGANYTPVSEKVEIETAKVEPPNSPVHEPSIHQTHESEMAHDGSVHDDEFPAEWAPPGALDAPEPRAGMDQRWVRFNLLGAPDPQNRSRQSGQGWRPRRINTVPEGERIRYPSMNDSTWGDIIAQGALVLCERPMHLSLQRKKYFDDQRKGQMQALVDQHILPDSGRGYGAVELHREKKTIRTPIVASDD